MGSKVEGGGLDLPDGANMAQTLTVLEACK